jgi:hypothetical protein
MGLAGCRRAWATIGCSGSGLNWRGTPRSERLWGCQAAKPPRWWAYHPSSNVRTATGGLTPAGVGRAEDEAPVSRAIFRGPGWATSSWTLLTRLNCAKATAGARSWDDNEFMRATLRQHRPSVNLIVVWGGRPHSRNPTAPGPIAPRLRAAPAGNDNLPPTKSCRLLPGTSEGRPAFAWPAASVATVVRLRKPCSGSTDQRLLLRWKPCSETASMPDAEPLLRARQAVDRVRT